MPISIRWIAPLSAIMIGFSHTPTLSGEIGGKAGGCAPSAAGACHWTSTKCTRPAVPMLYSASTQELNQSADQLNKYVGDLNAYMQCLSDEGQTDAKSAVDVVQAGVNQRQNDATADFNQLRSQYDADRLRLQTQGR